jgi:hypothetical protein
MSLSQNKLKWGATLSSLNLFAIGISLDPLWLIASFRRNRRHDWIKARLIPIRLSAAQPFGEIDIVIGIHRLYQFGALYQKGDVVCHADLDSTGSR